MKTLIKLTGFTILICVGLWLIGDTLFSLYVNGIPKIHNGHVIYASQRYNKFYNYEWTDVEILTYSGDSHHVYFWGHPEFKLHTNYHIHTKITRRFFLLPFPSWQGKETIMEVEIIDS